MTEEEFRRFLYEHKEKLEKATGVNLTPERIEQMVQDVQGAKRLRALQNQNNRESERGYQQRSG